MSLLIAPDQEKANEFWRGATTTFLGSPEFYEKQARLYVEKILPRIGHSDLTVDLGCGNGRFTEMIAAYSNVTIGVDIGTTLLQEARVSALQKNIRGLVYTDSPLEQYVLPTGSTLVSCTGVTCCLVDDRVFHQLIDDIDRSLKPGGFLLLKDTLSLTSEDQHWSDPRGYLGRYRTIDRYFDHYTSSSRDWEVVESEVLAEDPQRGLRNFLTLLRVNS